MADKGTVDAGLASVEMQWGSADLLVQVVELMKFPATILETLATVQEKILLVVLAQPNRARHQE